MSVLKGQNLRILVQTSEDKAHVIAMATSCTVTLTNNTEDESTKDDEGLSSRPVATSKSWQVSVESLSTVDAAAMLTAIKNHTPFTLVWDETQAAQMNSAGIAAAFARKGQAYLNDLTLTFNDRETTSKSLQFTGSGELSALGTTYQEYEEPDAPVYAKGQFTRLFLGSDNTANPSTVIAAARQLSLHVSCTLEAVTTKDTTGDWQIQEVTGISYDISTSALVRSGDTITSSVGAKSLSDLETIYEAGTPVKFRIAAASGANQRTAGTVLVSGSVVLSTLTINAANKQSADYTAQLTGYGPYNVAA